MAAFLARIVERMVMSENRETCLLEWTRIA
jgi:hypothetical protein